VVRWSLNPAPISTSPALRRVKSIIAEFFSRAATPLAALSLRVSSQSRNPAIETASNDLHSCRDHVRNRTPKFVSGQPAAFARICLSPQVIVFSAI
jgi:hypothetical protein